MNSNFMSSVFTAGSFAEGSASGCVSLMWCSCVVGGRSDDNKQERRSQLHVGIWDTFVPVPARDSLGSTCGSYAPQTRLESGGDIRAPSKSPKGRGRCSKRSNQLSRTLRPPTCLERD